MKNPVKQYLYTCKRVPEPTELANLKQLLDRNYPDDWVILVNVQSDYAERSVSDYCVCKIDSDIYKDLMHTDDYSDVGSIKELSECINSI